jgi:hypothetical protein
LEGESLPIPGMTRIRFNLNKQLVDSKQALGKTHNWRRNEPVDAVFDVMVTSFNASGEIYLHDVKSKPTLEKNELFECRLQRFRAFRS